MGSLAPEEIRELLIRFSIEAILLTTVLLIGYFRFGIREMLARIGGWRAKAIFMFVALMTVTQLVDRWQYHFPTRISFYPLARFAMYQTGERSDYVDRYQFRGSFGDQQRDINLTEHFGAIGLPSINTRFRRIAENLNSPEPENVQWAQNQIDDFCRSIVQYLDAKGETVPNEIQFVVERFDVRNGFQAAKPTPLKTYRFSVG